MTTVAAIRLQLWDIVPAVLARDPRSSKELARDTGLTPRSVENLRQRQCLPNASTLIALERAIPELTAEIARLRHMEADMDPDAERAAIELFRASLRIIEQRASRARER